jgi:hypothetical protein
MYIKLMETYDPRRHNLKTIRRWISAAAPLGVEDLKA